MGEHAYLRRRFGCFEFSECCEQLQHRVGEEYFCLDEDVLYQTLAIELELGFERVLRGCLGCIMMTKQLDACLLVCWALLCGCSTQVGDDKTTQPVSDGGAEPDGKPSAQSVCTLGADGTCASSDTDVLCCPQKGRPYDFANACFETGSSSRQNLRQKANCSSGEIASDELSQAVVRPPDMS